MNNSNHLNHGSDYNTSLDLYQGIPRNDKYLDNIILNQRQPINALYLHIPFCFHKCHYCDFYSIVDDRDRQQAFTQRLISEIQYTTKKYQSLNKQDLIQIHTIFVGGGTPTLLKPELWQPLLQTLQQSFDLSQLSEFTVEAKEGNTFFDRST